MVLKEERVLVIHSPHLQFLPARDSNSQPLGYKSDSINIRPPLPPWLIITIIIIIVSIIIIIIIFIVVVVVTVVITIFIIISSSSSVMDFFFSFSLFK